MASKFDREAFVASPFMQALTDEKVLSAYDKKAVPGEMRAYEDDLRTIRRTEAIIAFHDAMAASERHYLARVRLDDWSPGDARTIALDVAHDDAALALLKAVDRWARVPCRKALSRSIFAKSIKEFRRAVALSAHWEAWKEREPSWLAAVEATNA